MKMSTAASATVWIGSSIKVGTRRRGSETWGAGATGSEASGPSGLWRTNRASVASLRSIHPFHRRNRSVRYRRRVRGAFSRERRVTVPLAPAVAVAPRIQLDHHRSRPRRGAPETVIMPTNRVLVVVRLLPERFAARVSAVVAALL